MAEEKVKNLKSKVKTTSKNSRPKADQPLAEKKAAVKKEVKSSSKKVLKDVKKVKAKEEKSVITFHAGMTVDVFNTEGKKSGTMELSKEIFGGKINKAIIAQAVRVYLVNQRLGTVSTKTRGEVAYSTRKIYQQKGTGRARHGGRGAPIFVKGGIAHGPKPKEYKLSLPKAMKTAAFISALSVQKKDNAVVVISGLVDLQSKTKIAAHMLESMGMSSKKRNILFVLPEDIVSAQKALRNLSGVKVTTSHRLNTYDIISHKNILFAKEAIDALVKRVN